MICPSWWALSVLIVRTQGKCSPFPYILAYQPRGEEGIWPMEGGAGGPWLTILFFYFFFSRSADCSSLDMLNKGDLLLKLFSCDQHHILRKTPPSWSHALALKKSKGKRLMTSTIPVLRSCHIHRIAHCDGWTRPLIFCLGDHCLSKWLLTLLLQYFQKLTRRCLRARQSLTLPCGQPQLFPRLNLGPWILLSS